MLRDAKRLATSSSPGARALVIGLLVLIGLAVSGLRIPEAPIGETMLAAADDTSASGRRSRKNSTTPQAPNSTARHRAQSRNNLRRIALAFHNYHDVHFRFPPAVVIGPDGKTPHSWRVELLPFLDAAHLYRQYNMKEPWDSENNKKVLKQMPAVFGHPSERGKSTNTAYFALTGPKTLFEGRTGTRIRDITDGMSYTILVVETKRSVPWTKPQDIPFDIEKPLPKLGGYTQGACYVVLADGSARVIPDSIDKRVLKGLFTKNGGEPTPSLPTLKADAGRSRKKGTTPPAPNSAAAHRVQSRNNLKRIALAFLVYESNKHNRFPPAVVIGPDGKTPHSWRVELLPFLDAANLYRQYNMHEPWDSENNKKVLRQMPAVFGHPSERGKSTNTAYFVLTGPKTLFEGRTGTRLLDITDGTSNTILVVETKRSVPWTKPQDIPFDIEKPLPKLGGYTQGACYVVLADGSARVIPDSIDKRVLKGLFTKNGGEIIPRNVGEKLLPLRR